MKPIKLHSYIKAQPNWTTPWEIVLIHKIRLQFQRLMNYVGCSLRRKTCIDQRRSPPRGALPPTPSPPASPWWIGTGRLPRPRTAQIKYSYERRTLSLDVTLTVTCQKWTYEKWYAAVRAFTFIQITSIQVAVTDVVLLSCSKCASNYSHIQKLWH